MQALSKLTKEQKLANTYLFCLLFFALLLPFQPRWLPITLGIMLMGLVWVVSLGFGTKFSLLAANRGAIIPLFYYLVLAVACLYTPLPAEGSEELLLKFPFLAWAIMLGSLSALSHKHLHWVLKIFVLATAGSVLFCFADSLYSYMSFPNSMVFYFEELVNYRLIPPHYLGMFVNFGYGLVLQSLLRGRHLITSRRWSVVLLLIFFLGIIFISVRMQYLIFVVINAVLLFSYVSHRKSKGWAAGAFVLVVLFFSILAISFSGSRNRVLDTYHELRSIEGMVENKQTNPRVFLWSAAAEVIEDNFWLGTGPGAEGIALTEVLSSKEIIYWDGTTTFFIHQAGYNYHNVYLQNFAALGLPGFIAILLMFIWPLLWAKKQAFRPQGLLFLLVCFLSFLTESMLQRQAGVLFFSFFWVLFFVLKPQPVTSLKNKQKIH